MEKTVGIIEIITQTMIGLIGNEHYAVALLAGSDPQIVAEAIRGDGPKVAIHLLPADEKFASKLTAEGRVI